MLGSVLHLPEGAKEEGRKSCPEIKKNADSFDGHYQHLSAMPSASHKYTRKLGVIENTGQHTS